MLLFNDLINHGKREKSEMPIVTNKISQNSLSKLTIFSGKPFPAMVFLLLLKRCPSCALPRAATAKYPIFLLYPTKAILDTKHLYLSLLLT